MKLSLEVKIILLIGILSLTGFMWSQPHKHPGPMTSQHPAPYHIEWTEYPVGGCYLATPGADSAGHHRSVLLPPGSLLLIPREVEGPNPDTPDSVRTHS